MTRSSSLRPTPLPRLPRLWRGRHTPQLGLDQARAVVVEPADQHTGHVLDLLDGTRPERVVLSAAAEWGIAADDVLAMLDLLREAGLALSGPSLTPPGLPAEVRQRLSGEAVAIAFRNGPRLPTPALASPEPSPPPNSPTPASPAPTSPASVLRRRRA